MESLDEIRKDFLSWSGFELEGDSTEELHEQIKSKLWTLQCELNAQAKAFERRIQALFPEEE